MTTKQWKPTDYARVAISIAALGVSTAGAVKHSDRLRFAGRTILLASQILAWSIQGLALRKTSTRA